MLIFLAQIKREKRLKLISRAKGKNWLAKNIDNLYDFNNIKEKRLHTSVTMAIYGANILDECERA